MTQPGSGEGMPSVPPLENIIEKRTATILENGRQVLRDARESNAAAKKIQEDDIQRGGTAEDFLSSLAKKTEVERPPQQKQDMLIPLAKLEKDEQFNRTVTLHTEFNLNLLDSTIDAGFGLFVIDNNGGQTLYFAENGDSHPEITQRMANTSELQDAQSAIGFELTVREGKVSSIFLGLEYPLNGSGIGQVLPDSQGTTQRCLALLQQVAQALPSDTLFAYQDGIIPIEFIPERIIYHAGYDIARKVIVPLGFAAFYQKMGTIGTGSEAHISAMSTPNSQRLSLAESIFLKTDNKPPAKLYPTFNAAFSRTLKDKETASSILIVDDTGTQKVFFVDSTDTLEGIMQRTRESKTQTLRHAQIVVGTQLHLDHGKVKGIFLKEKYPRAVLGYYQQVKGFYGTSRTREYIEKLIDAIPQDALFHYPDGIIPIGFTSFSEDGKEEDHYMGYNINTGKLIPIEQTTYASRMPLRTNPSPMKIILPSGESRNDTIPLIAARSIDTD